MEKVPLKVVRELDFSWSFKALNISFVYAVPNIMTKAPSAADGQLLVCFKLLKKKKKKRGTIKHNETFPQKERQLFLIAIWNPFSSEYHAATVGTAQGKFWSMYTPRIKWDFSRFQ